MSDRWTNYNWKTTNNVTVQDVAAKLRMIRNYYYYYSQLYLVSAKIITTTGSSKPEYLADKDLKGGKAILKTCLEISKERLHFSDDYNTLWGSSRESMFDRFCLVQETESFCQVDDRNRLRFNDGNVNKYVEAITNNTSRYTR